MNMTLLDMSWFSSEPKTIPVHRGLYVFTLPAEANAGYACRLLVTMKKRVVDLMFRRRPRLRLVGLPDCEIVEVRLTKVLGIAAVLTVLTGGDRSVYGGTRSNFESINAQGVTADWISLDTESLGCAIRCLEGGDFMFRMPCLSCRRAAHEDSFAAYRWLLDQGLYPAQIILDGDCAGGVLFSPGIRIDPFRSLDAWATQSDQTISAGTCSHGTKSKHSSCAVSLDGLLAAWRAARVDNCIERQGHMTLHACDVGMGTRRRGRMRAPIERRTPTDGGRLVWTMRAIRSRCVSHAAQRHPRRESESDAGQLNMRSFA